MVPHTRRRSVAEAVAEKAMDRSSSDEEEESMEESEDLSEESDTESEGDMNNGPPPKKQLTSLPHHSSSEIAIHSNAIRNSAPELNPSSSKPTRESPRTSKKPRSKPATDVHPSSKSPADSLALQKVNNSKTDEAVELYENFNSDSKRQLFKRLWSEDDEIAILKGLIEHAETKGNDPASPDINSFYEFIRNSVHIDASKSQLKEKIRRMKKRKYQSYLNKNNNGGIKVFSKAHAQTCYDLSRKIWGTESKRSNRISTRANLGSPNLDRKIDQAAVDVDVATPSMAEPFYRQETELSSEKEMMKHWSRLITSAKKVELDDKLKRIQVKEMEVYLQRLDCMREQAALVLETLKSSINRRRKSDSTPPSY